MSSSRARSQSRKPLLRNTSGMDSLKIKSQDTGNTACADENATLGETKTKRIKENLESYQKVFGIDEDAFDQPTTTRKELWSFYLYSNGDCGVGPLSFSQALFQSTLSSDGWDPSISPIKKDNCTTGGCVVSWGSGTRSVSSVVLIANGLCFAVMTIIFVTLGSAADYGTFGRWILVFLTVICWVFQYGMIAIREPSQWPTAMALYIVSYISYGATLVFYSALFPRLSRYMPHVRKAREEDLKNDWVVLGIPWFIFQQSRPGPSLPKGSSYLTIGWKQVYIAFREIRHLPQTFTYLLGFFLLADGLNTTSTLVSLIQNEVISFSFLQLTYLGLSQAATSTFSTFGFWYFQQYFNIRTKTMFMVTNVFSVLIPLYGMLGLWTDTMGYHHVRDFWIYNIVFGLFQAPYYAYAQTMMSEVTPRGYENMFFGLFGITNRASSIIGPNVIQAIINNTNNNWMGFPFLFALCFLASIVIWFVDIEKGRANCRTYVEERKIVRLAKEVDVPRAEVVDRLLVDSPTAGPDQVDTGNKGKGVDRAEAVELDN